VNEDRSPHVVSVIVEDHGERLELTAGGTTRRNAERTPAVALLWPGDDDEPYSLIVDADVQPGDGEPLVLVPSTAILHRMAGRGDGPTCVAIDAPAPSS
jgi:hypothetical protein